MFCCVNEKLPGPCSQKLKRMKENSAVIVYLRSREVAIDFLALPDDMEDVPTKTVLKLKVERDNLYIEKKKKIETRMYDDHLTVAEERMNVVDIPKVSDEPELLVNCFIQHKVLENDNYVWLQGEVTGVDKVDNRNSHLMIFTLQYKHETIFILAV